MASEWSIRCSFISTGPVHLRKWEKARQTHGPDVAEFIRYFHTNWICPIHPLSGIREIIHTLLSACFHTMLHRNLGWSPACVTVFSSQCLIEAMKRTCGNISLLKQGRQITFLRMFFCYPCEVLWKTSLHHQGFFSKKNTWSLIRREWCSSGTPKDSSICTLTASFHLL